MKKGLSLISCLFVVALLAAQSPEITSWIINTTGATGYNSLPANVQTVQYSNDYVYVSCSCIPGYSIGPWGGNPNTPSNQNFVYKIPRHPQQNTGTATSVGLGHIGVWTNGVSIFNVSDAQSYNNQGIWNRNAYYFEGQGFDNCLGHPQQQGEYHHHVSPACLYDAADSTHHSPIIGWSFDGYPVYGAYGYANADGTGGIKRMASSFLTTTVNTRTNGPAVSTQYPVGCFIEDYTYTQGAGDLDNRNGRFCVTPEYPGGTYAYFVTIDANLNPVFPYTYYGSYYGVVPAGNTGMGSGHITISEATTTYVPTTGVNDVPARNLAMEMVPSPDNQFMYVYMDVDAPNNVSLNIYDLQGKLLQTRENLQPSIAYSFDLSAYPAGMYLFNFETGNQKLSRKVVKPN